MEKKGIDISAYQGDIDFSAVKDNVDFVLIRSGYGFYHEDAKMKQNANACESLGIPYGFYHYSYAVNIEEAGQEVEGMLQSIRGYHPTYPIIIDMEDGDGYKAAHGNPSNETYIQICKYFCDRLEEAGYYAMIYSNLNWFQTKLNSSVLDPYDKWLAQWGGSPTYTKPFGIWQYSSTGQINGIAGNVDLDIAYKDYPQIIRNKGLNQLDAREDPSTDVPSGNTQTYTVQKGDSLWKIAEKFYGSGTRYIELARINGIADPNKLSIGQVIKVPRQASTQYVVKKGDTISSIAAKYKMNWKTLYEQNKGVIGNNPDKIYPGQVLKI